MRLLLTGTNGFLGSALARAGLARGHAVAGLIRQGASRARLAGEPIDLVEYGDLSELPAIVERLQPDAVIHTAGSYGRGGETIDDIRAANVAYGQALLQACAASSHGAGRIFLNTGTALEASVSSYALTKREFSAWGANFCKSTTTAPRWIDIELQQMYGPGDDEKKLPFQIIRACLNGAAHMDFTAGKQLRDFVYIDDVVDGYYTLIEKAEQLPSSCVVPLGGAAPVAVKDFALQIKALTKSDIRFDFGAIAYRQGEPMCLVADPAELKRLGWSARVGLAQGLQRTIESISSPSSIQRHD